MLRTNLGKHDKVATYPAARGLAFIFAGMENLLPPEAPRLPGRPRAFDMALALDQAIAVFSERGYSGTSIADLSKATGLTAGSLYKAFVDKQALFLATLERYVALRNQHLQQLVAGTSTGREGVRQVLLWYVASSVGPEGRRGCLVVHSALELSVAEPAVAHRVAHILAANEAGLLGLVQRGQVDGSISAQLDGPATALLLLCLLQGMRVVAKTGRTQPEMGALVEQALHLLT